MKKLLAVLPLLFILALVGCTDSATGPLSSDLLLDEGLCDSTQSHDQDQTREGWQWGPQIKPSDEATPDPNTYTYTHTYTNREREGTGEGR